MINAFPQKIDGNSPAPRKAQSKLVGTRSITRDCQSSALQLLHPLKRKFALARGEASSTERLRPVLDALVVWVLLRAELDVGRMRGAADEATRLTGLGPCILPLPST